MSLNNLKSELVRKGIKQYEVAEFLGMTPSNFNKKLAEAVPFTIDEIKSIRDRFMPSIKLDYLLESDGDVPTERERLHHYAEAIGNTMTNDGEVTDPEIEEIVQKFHDCAEAYAERSAE